MKKVIAFFLVIISVFAFGVSAFAENEIKNVAESKVSLDIPDAKSAVLMEAETGEVIFSKAPDTELNPASVTKVMTLLLAAEALDEGRIALTDKVTVSAHAASMGGSQVFLKEGEVMAVEELIKCVVIASANDAALALAEHVSGNEAALVSRMNERAAELGMKHTSFENVTGLDDTTTNHYTSALDIAIMSRELIAHEIILKYSSIWQDTIRGGEFVLTNTNRLVRFYDGCNGLKTGSTSKAGYCVSATAKRGDMQLIAVVMGAETRDKRNEVAKNLLDFGFANYTLMKNPEAQIECVPVKFGVKDSAMIYEGEFSKLVSKADASKIEKVYVIPENISAPIKSGDGVGKVEYILNGEKIGEAEIYLKEDIEKLSFWKLFSRIICSVFSGGK